MRRLTALLVPIALVLAACGDDGSDPQGDSAAIDVVATTTVVGDFVRQIGGERVDLEVIMRPNVDAHDYEPSPRDIEAIRSADVVVRNGAGLEAWFDETIDASGTEATIVDASTGVTVHAGHAGDDHAGDDHAGDDHAGDDGHEEGDPHIWHDPRNAVLMVTTIADALRAADPAGAATYDANLARYTAEIEALDAEIAAQIDTLTNKKIVTNHDALGYYIDRYGLEFVGSVIPSFDSSAELSASALDDLVHEIEEAGVRAVFAESSLPGDAARTIADEAGVLVVTGDDALYGDSLGADGSDAATYLDMLRHNTETIVSNLRQAP